MWNCAARTSWPSGQTDPTRHDKNILAAKLTRRGENILAAKLTRRDADVAEGRATAPGPAVKKNPAP